MYDYHGHGRQVAAVATVAAQPHESKRQVKARGGRPAETPAGRAGAGHRGRLHHPAAASPPSLLLIVVSIVTFAIFFLVPRLAGPARRPSQRLRRQDRRPRPCSRGRAARLRRAAARAVRHCLKGIFVGRDYNTGPASTHCPAPVPRLLLQDRPAGLAGPARPAPVTALAGHRCGRHLAGLRRRHRRASRRSSAARSSTASR